MAALTQDELTVLMIAAEGQPMMPIGRWAEPTKALIAKGYLMPHGHPGDPTGQFNNYITVAGRAVCEKADNDSIRDLANVNNAIVESRHTTAKRAQELAVLLAELATYSSGVTGDDKVKSLQEWSKVILAKALELLK